MIVVETVMLVTMLCTSPCRRVSTHHFQYANSGRTGFQISSDNSLEANVTADLKNIPGVRSVVVSRAGNDFDVDVVLENLEFQIFDQVVKRELYLFDEFPEFNFRFSILPAVAVDEAPALHAA
jgi:hypothetical protein